MPRGLPPPQQRAPRSAGLPLGSRASSGRAWWLWEDRHSQGEPNTLGAQHARSPATASAARAASKLLWSPRLSAQARLQEHVTLASYLPHGTQARLQNDVPGFPAKRARAIIKEELGASVDELFEPNPNPNPSPSPSPSPNPNPNPNQVDDLFADFSDTPLAAASLAQVG